MSIHALTVVHPDAKIGKNVTIEPFTNIGANVVIGDDCWIGSNVNIFDGARIGKGCKIFPGASISAVPQDLKYAGEKTITEIGDNTIIREYVTINKGTSAAGRTAVGSNCLLMAYSHVAHDCIIGDNVIMANGVTLAGHIEIEDYAILEGLVAVQQFVKIGAHCFIAGGSLVRKNVPPFVKAAREPLSYVGINSVGLRRRGFSDDAIRTIQNSYRIIFQSGLNLSKAIEEVNSEIPDNEQRQQIMDFLNNSPKGIMKGFLSEIED